jgi:hypothetical protein
MAERHAALSCERLRSMQVFTRPASGMNSEQSRMASGVQAWRAASLASCALAAFMAPKAKQAGKTSQQIIRLVRIIVSSILCCSRASPSSF